ncbi:MAG: RidA family protein [Terriglobales bacterium]
MRFPGCVLTVIALLTMSIQGFAASGKKKDSSIAVHLYNPETMAKPVSTYSQVAEVTGGKMVFIAGQVALDPAGKFVGEGDFHSQVQQIFKNIKLAVEASGGSMGDLIKTNYYVAETVDPAQYAAVREVRDQYINKAAPPTSTFVVVKRLVRPEYLIEVEAVAVVNK